MKKFISIFALATLFVFSLGTSSSSAAFGYGDTMDTAMVLWNPYTIDTNEVRLTKDSHSDDDWYLINNSNGSSNIGYTLILDPPEGVDLFFSTMKMDDDGNIVSFTVNNGSGPGGVEAVSTGLGAGQKAYIRVMSVTSADYDEYNPYTLKFKKN